MIEDYRIWMALAFATLLVGYSFAAEPARVEAPPPPARPECLEKQIIQKADAICIKTGRNSYNGDALYQCFDKEGRVFMFARTSGSIS